VGELPQAGRRRRQGHRGKRLSWELKHGSQQLDFYRLQAEAGDAGALAALDAAPQITDPLAGLGYLAFAHLGSERQIGMGAGPIPWSKVRDWALDRGLDTPDERDDLFAVVSHLDGIWQRHVASKMPKPKPAR
jgi:hypothetical protein